MAGGAIPTAVNARPVRSRRLTKAPNFASSLGVILARGRATGTLYPQAAFQPSLLNAHSTKPTRGLATIVCSASGCLSRNSAPAGQAHLASLVASQLHVWRRCTKRCSPCVSASLMPRHVAAEVMLST